MVKKTRFLRFLIAAGVLAFVFWQGGWRAAGLVLLFWALIGLAMVALLFPFNVRRVLLLSTAPDEPRAAALEEWPQRDKNTWEQAARECEDLGFEPLMVKASGEKTPKLGVTVSQLWLSQSGEVLAEISQTFLPARQLPVTTALVSFWGDRAALEAQARALAAAALPAAIPIAAPVAPTPVVTAPPPERLVVSTYSTHNRAPHWMYQLLRHPQIMGARRVGARPKELWAIHGTNQAKASRALQQAPLRGDLAAAMLAQNRVVRAIWHRRLQRGFTVQLLRARLQGKAPSEVWGELDSRIRALSA